MDEVRGDAAGEEAIPHAGSEGDDAIGAAAGEIGNESGEAFGEAAGTKGLEGDGDVGIEIHFPDDVARAAEALREVPGYAEQGRGGEGEDDLGIGAEDVPEGSGVVRAPGGEAGDRRPAEGGRGGVDDVDHHEPEIGPGLRGRGALGRTGVRRPGADDRNALPLVGELRRDISEKLAGRGGVRGEELVDEERCR
jgi:hypothetical protein